MIRVEVDENSWLIAKKISSTMFSKKFHEILSH